MMYVTTTFMKENHANVIAGRTKAVMVRMAWPVANALLNCSGSISEDFPQERKVFKLM